MKRIGGIHGLNVPLNEMSKKRGNLLSDFSKLNSIKNHFKNYNACFHCMGISAVGVSEKTYKEVIFDITKNLVDILYSINKNLIIFR